MSADILANVAVDAALGGGDAVLTYRLPHHLQRFIRAGQLVWVPLRRQRVQGIVLDMFTWPPESGIDAPDSSPPGYLVNPAELRDILDLADPEALLTPAQLRLARWLSAYYRTSFYTTLALMLPTGSTQQSETTWRASVDGLQTDLGTLPLGERGILYFLRQHGESTAGCLCRTARAWPAAARQPHEPPQNPP